MSHELSTTNGVVSFADSATAVNGRTDTWHTLGQAVGHKMTGQEALEAAHLANWNVRKRPIWADIREDGGEVRGITVPGKYATVFDNPITGKVTAISTVGERYTCIQKETLVEFGDAVVDASGGAHWHTAGSYRNYSQTFLTMKLPRTMVLTGLDGKTDVTEWYLALFNSHDGSSSMFGLTTTVRVVCANTANAAIKGAHSKFSIPHTSGWKGAVQVAREKLGLSFEYQEAFEAEARALFETPMSDSDMVAFTEELVDLAKVEQGSAAATKRRNEAQAIQKLWISSPTIKGTPVAGTRYGAYNAVTEYMDHFAPVRGAKDANVARATRTLTQAANPGVGLKADAFRLLTSV